MATKSIPAVFPREAVQRCRPGRMIACLLICDASSLAASGVIPVLFKLVRNDNFAAWHAYASLFPLLFLFLIVFSALGLYSGVSLGSPEELRRLTLSSIFVSMFSGVMTFSIRGSGSFFTLTMLGAAALCVVLVPLMRAIVRLRLADRKWWGYPTVVFGERVSGEAIIQNMVHDPALGLKPIGFFSSNSAPSRLHGVPAVGEEELGELLCDIRGAAYAVLTGSAANQKQFTTVLSRYRSHFSHILVVPSFAEFSCLWVTPKNLGGMLGLEVYQQVFSPSRRFLKRLIDLILVAGLGLTFAPFMLLIAIAIKLDSRGPVLYRQRRVGRSGREFFAWKFRSMAVDADQTLQHHLDKDPALLEEWMANRKLKNDPRITRFGGILRRTSLDELPQLWNVLRGEMSLVGPRPIVHEEVARYGADFETYALVLSGLTGLWQVSGRSDTSYGERVAYDRFYVLNWSVWLDICILFRTLGTVLSRVGAV